jgi:hypothetical protein
MGLWSRLFRARAERGVIAGDGEFRFHVVGTSHHQRALETLCGERTPTGVHYYCAALVAPQPNKPFDRRAAAVTIHRVEVGCLERDVAPEFLKALRHEGCADAVCKALIIGGWDRGGHDWGYYGVRLDACMPFSIVTATAWREQRAK